MNASKQWIPIFAASLLLAVTVQAARVDMKDPRRAVGREDDIRVDCELSQDSVSNSGPINVTYQVQNLTNNPIAIADKDVAVSYDEDTRTISFSVGAEIPDEAMPHLIVVAAGAKKTLTAGGMLNVALPAARAARGSMQVQVRVNVLRDLKPFSELIAQASRAETAVPIPNTLFDTWIDATDTILCNTIPVRWNDKPQPGAPATAEQRTPAVGTW